MREKREKKPQTDREKRMNKAQEGYERLFINLGKRDGFYPGELMQTLNRYVGGRQEVGHIDLLDTISYFEVPKQDARKVMTQLTGIRYKGRVVRCNSEDDKDAKNVPNRPRGESKNSPKINQGPKSTERGSKKRDSIGNERRGRDDWRQLMQPRKWELRGPEPDFTEEGWARRKPKKKK